MDRLRLREGSPRRLFRPGRVALAILLLTITGCDMLLPAHVQECEEGIKAKLRSPSTYKRIAYQSTDMTNQKPAEVWVTIEYDAANAYGTPIRDSEICKYPADDASESAGSATDEAAAASQAATDAASAAAAAATDAVPVAPSPPAAPSNPARATTAAVAGDDIPARPERCFEDYCPCDEHRTMDRMLCRNMHAGMDVTDQELAAGAAMRDANQAMDDWKRENP